MEPENATSTPPTINTTSASVPPSNQMGSQDMTKTLKTTNNTNVAPPTNNNMGTALPTSKKIAMILILLLIPLTVVDVVLLVARAHSQSNPNGLISDKALISVADQYIKARDDAVGVDQATPTSWLNSVKPITTSSWYATLQKQAKSSPSSVQNNFLVAHLDNYIVKVNVGNCILDLGLTSPPKTGEAILCKVTDTVNSKTSGATVSVLVLRTENWYQPSSGTSAALNVVKQGGHWLVNNDLTT